MAQTLAQHRAWPALAIQARGTGVTPAGASPAYHVWMRGAWLALVAGLCIGAARSAAAEEAPQPPAGPPTPAATEEPAPDPACSPAEQERQAILDRMQRGVFIGVCGTARWFDGLFGTGRYDQDSDDPFGRLGIQQRWDDRDGMDTRLRLRVRAELPTMNNRLRLFFGRSDDREIAEDTEPDSAASVPESFGEVEDESWLLGLGYSRQGQLEDGFDFGAGVRIRNPLDPYVKGSYRHNWIFNNDTALRARQTLFWRDSRGFGETTEIDLDHLLTPRVLLRWDNAATLAEDVRRLEWYTGLIAFQSLGDRRALSYTTFINGVVNTDVPARNYGFELRYRQRILREWLFLEARTSATWPKEFPEEERKFNPGVSLGFEMYFGPVPDGEMR